MPLSVVLGLDDEATPVEHPVIEEARRPTVMADPLIETVAGVETWNGRLAMMGFVIGLGTELLTGQGILNQIGL